MNALSVELSVPDLFGDHMVLQQKQAVPVWGKARAGSRVEVCFLEQKKTTEAGPDGSWRVDLEPVEVSAEPADLTVRSGEEEKVIKDVLVGEVWHCAGQSNMGMRVNDAENAEQEIAAGDHPLIRYFSVSNQPCHPEQGEANGRWIICSPESVANFSAAGYFFGRDLQAHLGIPVGLVNTSWGGTPAEAWVSQETLEKDPELAPILERYEEALKEYPEKKAAYDRALEPWQALTKRGWDQTDYTDPGDVDDSANWASLDYEDKDWEKIPGGIAKQWAGPGVVWFRSTVTFPKEWEGKELCLEGMYCTATVYGAETLYVNGAEVLKTTKTDHHRASYQIPGRFVKAGRAVITFRVFTDRKQGRIDLFKVGPEGDTPVVLRGDASRWRAAASGADVPVVVMSSPGGNPMGPNNPQSPVGLYNGRISPFAPFAVRGAIWYQGESNTGRAEQYRTLLPALMRNWREIWGEGDFPFLIVQLAACNPPPSQPGDSTWAELREAQALAAATEPNAGFVVAIDIGDAVDVHPKYKQELGRRLALAARGIAYDEDLVYSGPVYDSMTVEGQNIRIRFHHTGSGLMAKGNGPLSSFAIAGEDRHFVWAKTVIEGDTVVVRSDDVPQPVAVRYAWANNPEGCNLYNREGLPAAPFRTDTWPGVTAGKK